MGKYNYYTENMPIYEFPDTDFDKVSRTLTLAENNGALRWKVPLTPHFWTMSILNLRDYEQYYFWQTLQGERKLKQTFYMMFLLS